MNDSRPVPNPIPKYDFFKTKSINEVLKDLQSLTGKEQIVAIQVAILMLNACHQTVEDEILSKDIFAI